MDAIYTPPEVIAFANHILDATLTRTATLTLTDEPVVTDQTGRRRRRNT